jgi:hypothetical protein
MKKRNNNKIIIGALILINIYLFYIYLKRKPIYEGNENKKTIYLVWRNKRGETGHGFGDKLRGAIFMKQYCDKNNINLVLDATDDVAGDFLKNVKSNEYDIIKTKELLYVDSEKDDKIEKLNNAVEKTDELFMYTNFFPLDNLSNNDKAFAKKILEPMDYFAQEIETKMVNLPKNYGIQHFRFPDKVFENDYDENNSLFKKYFNILKSNYKETDCLLTNSLNFKEYAKQKLNIKTIECGEEACKVQHIGKNTDYNSVKNSFIEFFIATRSKYIKTHSTYDWTSGFVDWPSKIFDIPLENVHEKE